MLLRTGVVSRSTTRGNAVKAMEKRVETDLIGVKIAVVAPPNEDCIDSYRYKHKASIRAPNAFSERKKKPSCYPFALLNLRVVAAPRV